MRSIGAFEAKTHLSSLLDAVAQGEQILITRHGSPVAKLVPVGEPDTQAVQAAIARLKAFSQDKTLGEVSVQKLRDEGRR